MNLAQIKDAGNWLVAPPAVIPRVLTPFIGTPFPTLERGVVGTTLSVVGTAGKGGTLTFNYSPVTDQTPANVPVRVPLHITDLSNPLLVPLQNVESYFWLEFAPDDNTLGFVAIACVHHLQAVPPLIRFLSQTVTDNEAVGSSRAFLSARKADGTWPAVGFGQGARAVSLPTTMATEDLAAILGALPVRSYNKVMLTSLGLIQTVKTGAGVLHAIVLGSGSTVLAYDDPGTGILNKFLDLGTTTGYLGPLDIAFINGLRLTFQNGKTGTVIFS